MPITAETLARLARFDTPTICNVIELFYVRPRNEGYMDHRIQCNFPHLPPMVGFACTAAFRSDAPPAGGDAYGSMDQQVARFAELPGPAVVVFQDLDDPPVAATFGEVMCTHVQGVRLGGADHLRRRARHRAGQGDRLSRLHRLARSAPTPTATSCTSGCRCASAG